MNGKEDKTMNTQFFQKTLAPSANTMFSTFEKWGYGLLNATIVGGATSASSVLGIIMAKGVGLDMPPLNWKEIGISHIKKPL